MTDLKILGEVEAKPDPGDERFHSVTTVIGVLDKPALMYWAAEQTAIAAVDQASYLNRRIEAEGRETVIKELRDARFKKPKTGRSAADRGTAVHDACEQLALTGVWPEVDEEIRPYVEMADRLMQNLQPKFLAAECAVYNRTYGVAGTADGICEIDGRKVIFDWKTTQNDTDSRGKLTGPYPEHSLQLSAYRHMELMATWRARRYNDQFRRRYYLLSATEAELGLPMPETDGGVIFHLAPHHGGMYPVRCGAEEFESFLFVMEAFKWQREMASTSIEPAVVIVTPND